jgi:hypothetical protein
MTVEQPSNAERRIGAEMRDYLARKLCMSQGFGRLLAGCPVAAIESESL